MRALALGLLVALALPAAPAAAQPDPFEDYDAGRRGAPGDAPPVGGDARVLAGSGSLVVGLATVFGFTRSAGEGLDGGERVDTTFFTRISPSVGLMIIDGLEVAFAPGLAWRRVERGEAETTTERALLLRGAARYQGALDSRILGVVGVELGGYVGGSERPLTTDDGRAVDEATDTAGFSVAVELGLGFVLDPRTVLDAGLTLDWLSGSEDIASEGASLGSSLLHTGLRLGLRFFF